uniref:Uncharacterized protein n=1 Tax=Pipistrellus kuhlii TaxID=59472 RepID=A0A7J7XAW2_PIPKU|nr:hypothetical protein mPipKuh1_010615 [Pipistrellus kuhlii]
MLAGSYRALGLGRWGKRVPDRSSSLGTLTASLPLPAGCSQATEPRPSQGLDPKAKAWTCSDPGRPRLQTERKLAGPPPRASKLLSSHGNNGSARACACPGRCSREKLPTNGSRHCRLRAGRQQGLPESSPFCAMIMKPPPHPIS